MEKKSKKNEKRVTKKHTWKKMTIKKTTTVAKRLVTFGKFCL